MLMLQCDSVDASFVGRGPHRGCTIMSAAMRIYYTVAPSYATNAPEDHTKRASIPPLTIFKSPEWSRDALATTPDKLARVTSA